MIEFYFEANICTLYQEDSSGLEIQTDTYSNSHTSVLI